MLIIMGCLYLQGAITHMVKQKIRRCEICISAKSPIVCFLTKTVSDKLPGFFSFPLSYPYATSESMMSFISTAP